MMRSGLKTLILAVGFMTGSPVATGQADRSNTAKTLSFQVRGEEGALLHESLVKVGDDATNVGALTLQQLEASGLDWAGTETSIQRIGGLESKVEFVDGELRIWGWCFSVDGTVPDTTPDQTEIRPEHRMIVWFWGWASQRNGEWTAMCAGHP
jgi:hypothetical protein